MGDLARRKRGREGRKERRINSEELKEEGKKTMKGGREGERKEDF